MLQELDHGAEAAARPTGPALPGAAVNRSPTRSVEVPAGEACSARRPGRCPSAGTTSSRSTASTSPAFAIDEPPGHERGVRSSSSRPAATPKPASGARPTGAGARAGALEQPHAWRARGRAAASVRGPVRGRALRRTPPTGRSQVSWAEADGLRALARCAAADRGRVAPRGARHVGRRRATLALGRRGARRPPRQLRLPARLARCPWARSRRGRERLGRARARRQRLGVDRARRSRPSPASRRCRATPATRPTSSTARTSCCSAAPGPPTRRCCGRASATGSSPTTRTSSRSSAAPDRFEVLASPGRSRAASESPRRCRRGTHLPPPPARRRPPPPRARCP